MMSYTFHVSFIFCSDFVSRSNAVFIDFDHLKITFLENAVQGTPSNFSQHIILVQLFFVHEEVLTLKQR